MATGTTSDFNLTRNQIISAALRKVKGWPEDGNPAIHKIRNAIQALNLLIRREDAKQTGLSKSLWALDSRAVILAAGRYIYGEDEGLTATVKEIHAIAFRGVDGGDTPIDWISTEAYAALTPKNETGDPSCVYLKKSRLIEDQKLYIWPAPSSLTDTSDEVVVSEIRYQCILKHTSAAENKPGTGVSASIYWQQKEAASGTADTWVTATAYANGPLIYLTFKRALYDFDTQYDNPDFPSEWGDYLIYKLALSLAPEYDIGMEQRNQLKADLRDIESELFPSSRPHTNTAHNKAKFF